MRALLVTLLLVASPFLLGGVATAKSHRACDPRHSYTLTANDQVRVYAVVSRSGPHDAWACYRRTGRRFELGAFDPHDPDYCCHVTVRLAGRLVGSLAEYHDHYGEGDFRIVVRNVKTGEVLHRAQKAGNDRYDAAWLPARFVMDRAGSVAWTALGNNETDGSYQYYVFKSDTTRWGEILDSGREIDFQSLRRNGKTLTWTNGGTPRTARFAR